MLTTYSYTALKTFRACPRKFKFQYVDRVKIPKKVNAVTYLGSVIHRVLARLYQLGSDGIVWPVDNMTEFHRKEWESVKRDAIILKDEYHTVDDYIRQGEKMLRTHYKEYQPFDRGTLLGTELSLYFTLAETTFKFSVRVDRLWKHENGVIEICDYKTGARLVRPQEEDFFYQMGLYQLAVRENYPQFQIIELAQYLLRMNEVVRYRMRPDELDMLVEDLRVGVIDTIQAERLDSFPPKEGHYCNYCEYVGLCPAKRHKLMLQQQVDKETSEVQNLQKRAYELATRYVESYERSKVDEAELAALRTELIELSKDQNLTTFEGESGQVMVKVQRREKFITKSQDVGSFADLSHLARKWKLDDYFTLDVNALMKEIYRKERLSTEQLEQLKQYIVDKEESRVTVKLNREQNTVEDL